MKLKPGNLVRLKSGGPVMVVSSVNDDTCTCTWFSDDHSYWNTEHFTVSTLVKEKKAKKEVSE